MSEPAIPDEVLEQDVGAFAKKGAGKTYMMKGLVERLLRLQRRVVILDPLGMWWGLKFSPDGGPGFPIAVVGGKHWDVILDPTRGEELAAWVADGDQSLIIDLADLKRGPMIRFATAFLAELYRRNDRAIWLVLEEADVFAPMQPMNDATLLLHEVDQIARRGRAYGFRLWSLTQRPAKLHTDIRAMISALVMLKITSPHDRAAAESWIVGNASKAQAAEIVSTLASLPIGEGWVWAPDVDLLARMKFPPISTLDTSATPKAGEVRVQAKKAAPLDLGPLRELMKPGLGVVVDSARPGLVAVPPAALAEARADGYAAGHAEGLREGKDEAARRAYSAALNELRPVIKRLEELAYSGIRETVFPKPSEPVLKLVQTAPAYEAGGPIEIAAKPALGTIDGPLPRPLQAIIDAMWWWRAFGIERPTNAQAAYIAGYKPSTGTWDTYRARLRRVDLLVPSGDGRLTLTPLALRSPRPPAVTPTGETLRAAVRSKLDGPMARLFDPLVEAYPAMLPGHEWAERAGYRLNTGTWDTYVARLRRLELAEIPAPRMSRAAPWLFPESGGGEKAGG